MSAAAALKGWERSRAANTVREPLSLAPAVAVPRVWLYARLLDLSHLDLVGRFLAFVYYRVLRQPPAFRDEDGSLKFHDIRAGYGSRRAARARCEDPDDVLIGISYGRDYGPHVAEERTFCRPCHSRYREQDARDSLIYRDDLESEFARRLARLVDRAESLIEKCETV